MITDLQNEITYREITNRGIVRCRNLCNALMAHQADHRKFHPEVLRAMSFKNRMKSGIEKATEKQADRSV